MADHVIIQVRDAIIAKLKAGVTAVGGRVYRFDEIESQQVDESKAPFLLVVLGDDSAEMMAVNAADPPAILEDLKPSIFVHCAVKQENDPEAAAYNLRRDAESTLFATRAGRTLDGKVLNLWRVAGANNRDEAIDLGAYSSVLQLEAQIRHLDSQPDSFTY